MSREGMAFVTVSSVLLWGLIIWGAAAGFSLVRAQVLPPSRYQGDVTVVVRYVDPDQTDALCRHAGVSARGHVAACTFPNPIGSNLPMVSVRPNPAKLSDRGYLARLEIHENAHAMGWSKDHEQ